MPTNKPWYWSKNWWANYKKYHWTTKAKSERADRNTARNRAEEEWKVHKWDGKNVDHIKPLSKWWSNSKSNTRVISEKKNKQMWAAIANKNKWKGYKKNT